MPADLKPTEGETCTYVWVSLSLCYSPENNVPRAPCLSHGAEAEIVKQELTTHVSHAHILGDVKGPY